MAQFVNCAEKQTFSVFVEQVYLVCAACWYKFWLRYKICHYIFTSLKKLHCTPSAHCQGSGVADCYSVELVIGGSQVQSPAGAVERFLLQIRVNFCTDC